MILLDTHAFIWLVSDQTNLTKNCLKLIQNNPDELYISSISALEIALLVKRNRLKLPKKAEQYIEEAMTHHDIQEITINKKICLHSSGLPQIHDDPFDRIIIATAQIFNMTLISKDIKIKEYPGINVTW